MLLLSCRLLTLPSFSIAIRQTHPLVHRGLCGKIGINKPADPKFRQVCGVDSYTQSVCCGLAAYECQVKPTVKAAYEALSRPKKKLVVKPGNDNTHGPVGQ